MPHIFTLPSVSADSDDAVLLEWNFDVGDTFAPGDILASVETAKAAFEITAETPGVLLATIVAPGATLRVGDPLALLGAPDEAGTDPARALLDLGLPQDRPEPIPAPPVPGHDHTERRTFSSPLARRMARQANLDLATIVGTGPNGRIVRRDLEPAIAAATHSDLDSRHSAERASAADSTSAAVPTPDYVDVPHSPMRRTIAARLQQSVTEAPHFYIRSTVRADRLLSLRADLNGHVRSRISINDFIVKAVAHAHTAVPDMNVIWTDMAIRRFSRPDVAIAVSTESGLVTPVIRDVDSTALVALAEHTAELSGRARQGSLKQHELEGGSITVSNLGMFQVEEFAAIINPPHAAVLAVGAVEPAAVADNGQVSVASVIRLTLSVDHRPVDGATAARWMHHLVQLLESPTHLLVDP